MEPPLIIISIVILVTTPILLISNASNAKRMKYKNALTPLNIIVFLYSLLSIFSYASNSASNPMWGLALVILLPLLIFSSINLLYLLTLKIDDGTACDQSQTIKK